MVLDTSAMLELLLRTEKGEKVAELLAFSRGDIDAPHLLWTESLQVLRRRVRAGLLSESRALQTINLLSELNVNFHPHSELVGAVWRLKENFSAYDATYVALAEKLETTLVTSDSKLAAAPQTRVAIRVID